MPEYRLIKRKDSPRWFITWTEGRRSKRVSTSTEDHAQAVRTLHLYALEKDKPVEATPDQIAITQVLGWYWEEVGSKLPSKEQAMISITRFNDFYGDARVALVNQVTHDSYQKMRFEAGVGWQTINRERMVLRAALNHARKRHGLMTVPHVPSILASDPEAAPVEPRGRPLTIAELASLYLAAKSPHMRLFILVLLGTLCRPDAAKNLKLEGQMDFENRLIHLNPKGRKQTKKRRPTIPMASFLYNTLKDAKRTYVIEYHGEPIASTKTAWRHLRAAAGLGTDVNPYSIRHTMSRELRRRKVPGDQLSVMLGHRPDNASRTDLVYAPYEPGYCKEATQAVEGVFRDLMLEIARHLRAK